MRRVLVYPPHFYMEFRNDFKYDLKLGQLKEKELAEILTNKSIEVKYDQKASKTGNVYIEYMSRGKLSGLSTSQAEYYCIVTGECYHLIPSKLLKEKCRKYYKTNRDRVGGDNNTSKGILLPVNELIY